MLPASFVRIPTPALYVYEQSRPVHAQRGLLGALALSPPEDGIVLPHENTMAGPVSDRLALYTAVDADLEPIFLLYGGGGAASEAVAAVSVRPPLLDVTLSDGLRHRLWALTDPDQLAQIAADLHGRTAVIADGHHRYATYLQRQAAAHAAGQGPGPWDTGLTFLVDSTAFGPEVHPIHRVIPHVEAFELARRAEGAMAVHDLDGDDLDSGLAALATAGAAGPAFLLVSGDGGTLRLLNQPHAERLARALPEERSQAWRALDVSVLHYFLVADVWGLVDDIDTVRYEHDVAAAIDTAAASGGTAVLLNPTPVAAVTTVAAGGERMPRKSTLFTPEAAHRFGHPRPPRRVGAPRASSPPGPAAWPLSPRSRSGSLCPSERARTAGATPPRPRARRRAPTRLRSAARRSSRRRTRGCPPSVVGRPQAACACWADDRLPAARWSGRLRSAGRGPRPGQPTGRPGPPRCAPRSPRRLLVGLGRAVREG